MASMKFDLPLLDYKTRFALCQVKMRAILAQSSDLDEALDGFGDKGQKSWTAEEKRKDRKALSLIQLHLYNDILQEVLQEKTVVELWLKLESICMSKDLTSKMHVKMKLFTHKLQEGGSVMNHLSIFKEIVADLMSMEIKYVDKDLALLLLCSLPSSFTNFRDTILLSRDELTLAKVYEALQMREKMKGMVQSDVSSSKGEVLQNKEKRNGTYKPKNKSDGDGKASVVSDVDNSDLGHVLVAFAGCVAGRDEWILDSACSFHICSNRDWFSSYEFVQSGDVVRMGDNNPREIVGIGSVQIKMHDGMIRTLKDLYVLRGSTLHGSVTVATISNDEPSKTNLWHMRLGHMSELSMAELIKRDLLDGCIVGKMKFYEHYVFGTLDYVHADLWGLSRKPTYCGARYMLIIIDDYSRKVWPYFLKNKDDTFAAFKEWKVMIESLSTDISLVGSDEEQQHVSMQVEHVDDQETEIVDNNIHDIVQHLPPVLQPQNQSIADRRTKRNYGPRPHLTEECDMVHYAFSCAEQVENIHEPTTYTKAVVSGDREKWISTMQEEMQSLEKNGTWDVVRLPEQKKVVRCKWIFKRKEGLSPSEPPRFKASTDEDFEYMSRVPYSSVVGSLMYAMVCSRPDLSYAMSLVSRYMANPAKEH
ncbi:unnamed protein product [Miscanthus lutarioriparius]|uniref:Retrovirus-related Pol polyprotein from transposon TNT 1-94-like beta-barrel domain-containing protein n=1 Tax=Miscanthus lutarioriparius TaxID=422564 RepID=A0A811PTK1_9POAL|nr:unnamed protein product [Miscanthus lutarioriparius]